MSSHIDATGYWIAVTLVDEDGRDVDWVRMVMKEKGHGDIDIDIARRWLKDNPAAMCRCSCCAPAIVESRKRPAQLSLL